MTLELMTVELHLDTPIIAYIDQRIAELLAMNPLTVEQYQAMKQQPNEPIYELSDERWGEHD